MARNIITQKYYVYDPSVTAGDEFGRLPVKKDDKGVYILAAAPMIQYWVDQGLLGQKPVGELSGAAKDMLKQITRGRSESDEDPKRVPKYSKAMQSGAPAYAGTLAERRRAAQKKSAKKDKKPQTKKAAAPPAA